MEYLSTVYNSSQMTPAGRYSAKAGHISDKNTYGSDDGLQDDPGRLGHVPS